VLKSTAVAVFLCLVLGCSAENPRKDRGGPPISKDPRQQTISLGDGPCEPVVGPLPNAQVLGHWLANDRRANHTTFGHTPPDSSAVTRITDSSAIAKADASLDSMFSVWASQDGRNARKELTTRRDSQALRQASISPNPAPVNLYKAGSIYAVVPQDLESCGHLRIMPMVFFFDSNWRYLGNRS
jgi:hypothetical protein